MAASGEGNMVAERPEGRMNYFSLCIYLWTFWIWSTVNLFLYEGRLNTVTKKPQIPSCYNPVGWCSYSFPYKPHAPCILILCLPLGPQSPLLDPLSLVTPWTKRERVKTQRITGHLLKARLLSDTHYFCSHFIDQTSPIPHVDKRVLENVI